MGQVHCVIFNKFKMIFTGLLLKNADTVQMYLPTH